MENQHPYRAKIEPIADGYSNYLWSVMIPTYNCADYLRETLTSVLSQDPGSNIMQIEVIDDCSEKDDPSAVVAELGGGRVGFYRQKENIGYIKNFETCLERSQGQLVHILHGDDCVRDGFYSKLQKGFSENPQVGAAFCRHIYIDGRGNWTGISELEQSASGILPNWLEKIAAGQRIQTPSIVVRREVYERLGSFDRRFCCSAEDWEMWVRIAAANYPIWYEVEPLALYRKGLSSLTANSIRSGNNIQDFRKAIEIMQEYLPENSAQELKKKALNFSAQTALRYANQLATQDDFIGMTNQIKQALISSRAPSIISSILVLLTKFLYKNII